MSSEREVRILPIENLRVPGEGSSARGKSGPKARPKGVVDGQLVEIPVPGRSFERGVTQEDRLTLRMVEQGQAREVVRQANPPYKTDP